MKIPTKFNPLGAGGEPTLVLTLTNVPANQEIDLKGCFPLTHATYSNFDFMMDWGDGTRDHWDNSNVANCVHTYTTAGDYQVKLIGRADWITFGRASTTYALRNYLTSVIVENTSPIKRAASSFYGCSKLITLSDNIFDNVQDTRFNSCFAFCSKLNRITKRYFQNCTVGSIAQMFEYMRRTSAGGRDTFDEDIFDGQPLSSIQGVFYASVLLPYIVTDRMFANLTPVASITLGPNSFGEAGWVNIPVKIFNSIYWPKNYNGVFNYARRLERCGINCYNMTANYNMFAGCTVMQDVSLYNVQTEEQVTSIINSSSFLDRSAMDTRGILRVIKSHERPEYADCLSEVSQTVHDTANAKGWDIVYYADPSKLDDEVIAS